MNTVAYSINRTGQEGKTPIINHLKIFGSEVYIYQNKKERKWDKKGRKGIFVGYSERQRDIVYLYGLKEEKFHKERCNI